MHPAVKKFLSEQGKKGGVAGGTAKVRGDADYYRRIAKLPRKKRKAAKGVEDFA